MGTVTQVNSGTSHVCINNLHISYFMFRYENVNVTGEQIKVAKTIRTP